MNGDGMRRWVMTRVMGAQLLVLTWAGSLLARSNDVEVKLFQFRPGTLEVTPGSVVTWVNQDDIRHTVTAGTPETPGGAFGAALPGMAATATVRFAEPGVYPYFCSRHPAMRGEIRVR
jgi:plastocyanin